MAITHEQFGHPSEISSFAPMGEAAGGVAVVVLAILGLANIAPLTLLSVAVIVVGAALLLQAAAESAEFARAVAVSETGGITVADLAGGVTVEYLAGAAGVVLGILALLGIVSLVLDAVALLVFGAVLLINCGVSGRMMSQQFAMAAPTPEAAIAGATLQAMARQATMAVAGARAVIGIAAIVLGILALVSIRPEILVLVGLLAIGGALLLAGSAVAGPAAAALRR